jgi:hypothetical protein
MYNIHGVPSSRSWCKKDVVQLLLLRTHNARYTRKILVSTRRTHVIHSQRPCVLLVLKLWFGCWCGDVSRAAVVSSSGPRRKNRNLALNPTSRRRPPRLPTPTIHSSHRQSIRTARHTTISATPTTPVLFFNIICIHYTIPTVHLVAQAPSQ